ncbi:ComEC/Rec2 family competence protein [Candidatus Bipolaricaulota sp. J31]
MSTQRALLPGMVLALGVGCAVGGLVAPSPWPLLGATAALVLSIPRRCVFLLWAGLFCLGIGLGGEEPLSGRAWQQLLLLREVRGTVISMPDRHVHTVSCVLRIPSLDVRLLAYLPRELAPSPGDTLHLVGRFEAPSGGWGEYLWRRGIAGLFWADEAEVARGSGGMTRILHAVRERLLDAIERTWPGETASLVAALLLGSRSGLNRDLKEDFRQAGVAHLLALSGLHLGIIAYGLWRLLGMFRMRPGNRYPVLFLVIGLYIGLVGGRISLVRAGIMFGFLGLFWILCERGWVLRDWYDPLQGLSAAAIVVLLIWPWSARDLGFQLSFAATAGIVLGWPAWRDSPWRTRLPRVLRPAVDLLWVSLCAQGATLGFVGSAFGYISPYGTLANLVLIPWTGLIIWAGLSLLVMSPLGLAPVFGQLASRYLVGPYLALVETIAGFPGAALPVGRYFGLWYAFAALVFIAFWSTKEAFCSCGTLPCPGNRCPVGRSLPGNRGTYGTP